MGHDKMKEFRDPRYPDLPPDKIVLDLNVHPEFVCIKLLMTIQERMDKALVEDLMIRIAEMDRQGIPDPEATIPGDLEHNEWSKSRSRRRYKKSPEEFAPEQARALWRRKNQERKEKRAQALREAQELEELEKIKETEEPENEL